MQNGPIKPVLPYLFATEPYGEFDGHRIGPLAARRSHRMKVKTKPPKHLSGNLAVGWALYPSRGFRIGSKARTSEQKTAMPNLDRLAISLSKIIPSLAEATILGHEQPHFNGVAPFGDVTRNHNDPPDSLVSCAASRSLRREQTLRSQWGTHAWSPGGGFSASGNTWAPE
jgi:hypothetical protein